MTRKRRPEQQYIDRKMAEIRLLGITDEDDLLAIEDVFKGLYGIMDPRFNNNVLLRLWHGKPLTWITDEPDQWHTVGNIQVHRRAPQIERRDGKTFDTQGIVFKDEIGEMYFNFESEVEITFPYFVPLEPVVVEIDETL